ncbi:inverted formin-2-like [Paramacrobiotus metropolitanus]|uniref:inverted formin-2-like n=1 Tax=Paramacrobiotus metropolitanus TaxID=2943436 RepID=UPI002445CD0C|nr:inverted formin-2-like [Paramacrobiotus metropolitanus]
MVEETETDFGDFSTIMSQTPEKWKQLVRRTNYNKNPNPSLLTLGINQRSLRPADCLPLLKNPTLHNYRLLRDFLRNGDHVWMEDFLAREGLIMLLTALEELSVHLSRLEDVMVLLENISCIREVLNSEPGIEYIVRHKYDRTALQLAKALSSENIPVKHQVYELLSALSAYSPNGFRLAYKCLKSCQESRKTSQLFYQVVADLRKYADDETKFAYKASLLAFVNCMMTFCDGTKREEILRELDCSFFFETLCRLFTDDHSAVQLQIDGILKNLEEFDSKRSSCMSIHKAVGQMLATKEGEQRRKVTETLQHLAEIFITMDSDKCFTILEKLDAALSRLAALSGVVATTNDHSSVVNQATSPVVFPESTATGFVVGIPETTHSLPTENSETLPKPTVSCPPPPPPPPPPAALSLSAIRKVQPSQSVPLPPPPPPISSHDINRNGPVPPIPPPPPSPHGQNAAPVPPPPPSVKLSNGLPPLASALQGGIPRSGTWNGTDAKKIPQHLLKPLRWNKVFAPVEKLSHSIWRQTSIDETLSVDMDQLKALFKDSDERRGSVMGPMIKSSSHVELIDSKRSLKVNICLKKFKDISMKELVGYIDRLDVSHFDLDDLTGLMGILPTPEEVEVFKDYTGNVDELDSAEAFFYWIVKMPDFFLHVELMLCSKEFPVQAKTLIKEFNDLKECCDLILKSKSFRNFLHYVLQVGNVLNSGRTLGEAKAVKLDGLLKLVETASNEPKVSLLHFIVKEIQKQHSDALDFIDTFEPLGKSAGLEFAVLQAECQALLSRYDDLHKRLGTATESLQNLVANTLKDPKTLTFSLKSSRDALLVSIKKVADYFVEDLAQFKIEECFKSVSVFVKQINGVIKEFDDKEKEQIHAKEKAESESKPKISKVGIRLPGISTLPRNFGGLRNTEIAVDRTDDLDARIVDQLTKAINSGDPLRRLRRRS